MTLSEAAALNDAAAELFRPCHHFPPWKVVLLSAIIFQCTPYLKGAIYSRHTYIYIYKLDSDTEVPDRQIVLYKPVLGTGGSSASPASTETHLYMQMARVLS